jgi:hypothetical protein
MFAMWEVIDEISGAARSAKGVWEEHGSDRARQAFAGAVDEITSASEAAALLRSAFRVAFIDVSPTLQVLHWRSNDGRMDEMGVENLKRRVFVEVKENDWQGEHPVSAVMGVDVQGHMTQVLTEQLPVVTSWKEGAVGGVGVFPRALRLKDGQNIRNRDPPKSLTTCGSDSKKPCLGGALLTIGTTMTCCGAPNTPKELRIAKYVAVRNVILSMVVLRPAIGFVVFTDSRRVLSLCDEHSVAVVRNPDTNREGTPLLRFMFEELRRSTTSPLYGYMNGDLLFSTDLVTGIDAVLHAIADGRLRKRVLVVGRRVNFLQPVGRVSQGSHGFSDTAAEKEKNWWTLTPSMKPAEVDWRVRLMGASGNLFGPGAVDFFFTTRGALSWDSIPPFVIGRRGYDSWLVDHAVSVVWWCVFE